MLPDSIAACAGMSLSPRPLRRSNCDAETDWVAMLHVPRHLPECITSQQHATQPDEAPSSGCASHFFVKKTKNQKFQSQETCKRQEQQEGKREQETEQVNEEKERRTAGLGRGGQGGLVTAGRDFRSIGGRIGEKAESKDRKVAHCCSWEKAGRE